MPSFTKYNPSLEKDFAFIKSGPSEYEACCTSCNNKVFSIKNGGISQIRKHCSGEKHKKKFAKIVNCELVYVSFKFYCLMRL